MSTYRYCIQKVAENCFRVTEADGPSARGTGEYESLGLAQATVEVIACRPLDWESGPADPVAGRGKYWVAEFAEGGVGGE